ncbi:MAG: SHOCT domain-containing protein [Anaerolineae bacterium]|nr:SHOCT domain-containing protein [Anaerolineae bacterium]
MWRWASGWGCCEGSLGFGWWGILNLVFGVVLLALAALLAIWLVRRMLESSGISAGAPARRVAPEEILKVRYARGEITRDEYLKMLKDIEGVPSEEV